MNVQLSWDTARPGWLNGARRVLSPNHNTRPLNAGIDAVIVHGISLPPGEFGGTSIEALFTNTLDTTAHRDLADLARLRVSSHFLVTRGGEVIQFVAAHLRAWHAGQSQLGERVGCNDFSIGIELEGTDTVPYENVQYDRLLELIALLQHRFSAITGNRIVGHADIAPGRKTDPGPCFDWTRLRDALNS
jgi:AmpD protein